MILFKTEQLEKINNLDPLIDSKFKYDEKRWSKLNSNYKHLVNNYLNKEVSRKDVITAFSEYYNTPGSNSLKPFLISMIWGFADTGYGWHRTNKYIETDENQESIKKALDVLSSNNPEKLKVAFNELKKIDGLGVSYLTKVLYFATRALNYQEYALIFDIRVASSLVLLTTPREIFQLVNISPSSKYKDFANFNSLMHQLAMENNVDAEKLEMYLFNQEF